MELDAYFEQILTLEDYWNSKKEAFTMIKNNLWISSSNIISVGDQEDSDILPAQELGMQTLHVKWPHDLIRLL
jgi:FMN phosphatase YigB (HAD superfamily)